MIIAKRTAFVNEGDSFVTFIVILLKKSRRILCIKYYNIYLKKIIAVDII